MENCPELSLNAINLIGQNGERSRTFARLNSIIICINHTYFCPCVVFRDELLALSKENEHFEEDLSRLKAELEEERKNKCKLEKILKEASWSLRTALIVCFIT